MNASRLYAACLALAVPALSIGMDASAADPKARTERGQLVHRIVMKWGGHVQEAYGTDVRGWAMEMVPVFSRTSLAGLADAAAAGSFEAMNNALLTDGGASGPDTALTAAISSPSVKTLGAADNDLVYVPVTPCRIIDTRVAGGTIAANTTRDFDVTAVANYVAQGGDASNCGIGAAGSFAAAVINFTVVTPSGAGFITAFPLGTTQPLAATVNYTAGDIRGNLAIVRLDQGASANEMSVFTFAQTHLVADVTGYFINPQATALECLETTGNVNDIGAGSFGSVSTANCPAGYTITGGGCSMSTFDGRVVTTRTIVDGSGQRHFCAFRSEAGSGTVNGVAYSRCCRTPGRI